MSSRPVFNVLPENRWWRSFFFAVLSLIMGLGLWLLTWRDFDLAHAVLLMCHMALGGVLMLLIFGFALRGLIRTLGWFWALVRLPIHVLVILANLGIFFSTPELLIVVTTLLFWIDWRIIRFSLRRQGKNDQDIRKSRSAYADFAFTAGAILSGLLVTNNTPAVRDAHIYHAFALPILLIWFASKRFRFLTPPKKKASLAFYGVFCLIFAYFHYHKKFWRGDETDLQRTDVIQTVQHESEAGVFTQKQNQLTGSERCAQCHAVQFYQWAGSIHRFSTNNRIYQKVVRLYMEQEGTENVRRCMNCHDPAAAIQTDSVAHYQRGHIDNPEGVSCAVCHSISEYETHNGNGLYTIKKAKDYPFADFPIGTTGHETHKRLIRLDPRMHLRAVQRGDMYRTGAFCVACHRLDAHDLFPTAEMHVSDVFKEWQASPWHNTQNCVDCHMPRYQMDTEGYAVFDHRIMGINADIADYAMSGTEYQENLEDTRDNVLRYTSGDLAVGEYELLAPGSEYIFIQNPGYEPSGPLFSDPLEMKQFATTYEYIKSGPMLSMDATLPASWSTQSGLAVTIHTRNVRVGHVFPGGLADMHDIWLEVLLRDDTGRIVAGLGRVRPDGTVSVAAPRLGVRNMRNATGQVLHRHEFWDAVTADNVRIIAPLQTVTDTVRLRLDQPDLPAGTYTLQLRWNYRKLRPEMARWIWGEDVNLQQYRVLSWLEIRFDVRQADDGTNAIQIERQDTVRPPYSENISTILENFRPFKERIPEVVKTFFQ